MCFRGRHLNLILLAGFFLTQWAAVALALQSNEFFRGVSFLLQGLVLDSIQILSLDLDHFLGGGQHYSHLLFFALQEDRS